MRWRGPAIGVDVCGPMWSYWRMRRKSPSRYPFAPHGAAVAVREAKAHFSALVERAAAGEEIVISWHGRPRARLLPLAEEPSVLRVDREWLRRMTVSASQTPSEEAVRSDRDGRG